MTKKPVKSAVQVEGKRGAPTMSDVARLAGVSPMTVSRVMNGEAAVSHATRNKVEAAVAALNYVPNQAARGLAGAQLSRVGVLYNNPSAGYLSEFLVGLLNEASRNNVQLVVEKCDPAGDMLEQARRMLDNGIDAMILPPPLGDNKALIDVIATTGKPVATVACGQFDQRVNAIRVDDYDAAHSMTSHLITLGHERIGFVIGHPNQIASGHRLAGFKAALTEKGLSADPDLIAQGMFTYRSGLDAAELLLAHAQRPTAIFASNDDMAAAVVATAHRLGLDVPGDLTVAGFDDTPLASTIWPQLTTVRQPIAEMAEEAIKGVVRQIRAQRNFSAEAPQHVEMAFELVRRQSDAAPRVRPLTLVPRGP